MIDELYLNATVDELFELASNGDDSACAHYIRRKIEDGALKHSDLKYLDAAIKNHNVESAVVGAFVYGDKSGKFVNTRKEFLCLAILEQCGEKDSHKRLSKEYKAHAELIDENDDEVMATALGLWCGRCIRGKISAIEIDVDRMKKESGFPDYKDALVIKPSIVEPSGRVESDEVYVAYIRGKHREDAERSLCDKLTEFVTDISERCKIESGEVRFNGNVRFRFGGVVHMSRLSVEGDRVNIISDADIDINVSDAGRLDHKFCKHCGGALDGSGVCTMCGQTAESDSGDAIVIRKGKRTEALLCTQCGASVDVDENGKTAFCPFCGTTFAVNGESLAAGIYGINFASLKADMPEGATLPDVRFVRASVADDRLTAIMPASFIVMPDEMRRIKYNANAPKYIYTTPDSLVNLNITYPGIALSEADVFAFGQKTISTLKSVFPTAKFGEAKKLTAPQNIYYVDFLTAALDQSIYNVMFFFSLDGRQGTGSWNCLGKDRWFWAPIFEHAIRTVAFDSAYADDED